MRWHTDRTRENRNTGATIPYQVPRNTATLKVSPTKELALRKRKSQRHLTYGSNSIPLKSSSMSKCTYEIQLERRSRDVPWLRVFPHANYLLLLSSVFAQVRWPHGGHTMATRWPHDGHTMATAYLQCFLRPQQHQQSDFSD